MKRPTEPSPLAAEVVAETIAEDVNPGGSNPSKAASIDTEKNPHAVALGRLGGKKGGKARAAKLTARRRREIAQKAAAARWGKAT